MATPTAIPTAIHLLLLLLAADTCLGFTFHGLGVNYGTLGDDLPSPSRSVALLRAAGAGAVKIYDANPKILRAVSGTRLAVAVMVPNDAIPSLAASRAAAADWVAANLVPFRSLARIRFLLVGNEVLSDATLQNSTWPALVPAMTNLHRALRALRVRGVKVGTTVAMDALAVTTPPSAAVFRADIAGTVLRQMLSFLNRTRSFFFLDAYPYFVWSENYQTISLDYALFEGNLSSHYRDPGSGLTYTNLFDEMLDSVFTAMSKLGFPATRLVVAETGWPNGCDVDQIGGNLHNAAVYNRNLARRMNASPPIGTPARPGERIPTFVFSLYNENQKPGPGTERHWGLFYPTGSPVYPIDLTGRRRVESYPPLPLPENDTPYQGPIWCTVVKGKKVNATVLADALKYACSQGNATCDGISPHRPCFLPDRLKAHASYAFNAYWQQFRHSGGTCFFNGLAEQTAEDPSHGRCKFPSSASDIRGELLPRTEF